MAYTSTVVIEEVNGGNGQSARAVELSGPTLPLQGADWGGSNQLITTWYPGNPDEATQQNLGPREAPTKMNGDWRRTMMSREGAYYTDENGVVNRIINPQDLRDALEDIFRRGRRLRVTWSVVSDSGDPSQSGRLTREGRAKTWKFNHTRMQDIVWEVEFDWVGRAGAVLQKIADTRGKDVASDSTKFLQKLQALQLAAQQDALSRQSPLQLNLGDLERIANTPRALTAQFNQQAGQILAQGKQVVSLATTLASQPEHVVHNAVALGQKTVDSVNLMYDQLSRIPCELMTTRRTASGLTVAAEYFGRQSDAAILAAREAQVYAEELKEVAIATSLTGIINATRTTRPASVQKLYLTKPGDTPKRVSMKFYNSPDHDIDILRANRLSWYTSAFTPGNILVIPALTSQAGNTGGA